MANLEVPAELSVVEGHLLRQVYSPSSPKGPRQGVP